jgi:hypothetical protein
MSSWDSPAGVADSVGSDASATFLLLGFAFFFGRSFRLRVRAAGLSSSAGWKTAARGTVRPEVSSADALVPSGLTFLPPRVFFTGFFEAFAAGSCAGGLVTISFGFLAAAFFSATGGPAGRDAERRLGAFDFWDSFDSSAICNRNPFTALSAEIQEFHSHETQSLCGRDG